MIKNERQYRITRAQAEKFLLALRNLRADTDDRYALHPRLRQLQEDALRSQLSDLEAELREYEDLKEGRFAFEKLEGISELPKLLIRARIASGLTQRDLAGRLELKEQQIQRYEASEYASASFTRIKEVVSALGIEVDDNLSVDDGIDDWPQ
jgi:ribosome-binding protein aMBF1 (putative translation factor)